MSNVSLVLSTTHHNWRLKERDQTLQTKCDEAKERGMAKRRKGGLTNDCVPSRDDAVKDAIKHDPVRKQGGHDLPNQPAECSSCKRKEK